MRRRSWRPRPTLESLKSLVRLAPRPRCRCLAARQLNLELRVSGIRSEGCRAEDDDLMRIGTVVIHRGQAPRHGRRRNGFVMSSFAPQRPDVTSGRSENGPAVPAALARRHGSGFWAVAFAFLIVMAFATLPSPLYGLYRARDHLSALTVTVVYAIFAAGTIAALLRVRSIAERVGRKGVMLGAVTTMMMGAGLLAAWKTLPVLLLGRLLTGVAVGLAAGTAITYLIELRVRAEPNASPARARNIGTSVNVGALGVGPLVAGCLAQWAELPLTLPYLVFIALGAIALIGLATAPETGTPGPQTTMERAAAVSPASVR